MKKGILSLACLASVLVAAWLLPVGPAQGESNFRSPEIPQDIIVSDTLGLLTLNVAHGRGSALNQLLVSTGKHRQNLADIASILKESGAHIVALQEADAPSLWSGKFDHVEFLAQATDYSVFVHGYHADAWPFTYGAALMSPFKMRNAESHRFSPSWPTATKGYVHGTVWWRGGDENSSPQPVTVVSAHLDFSREDVRRAQVAELVDELGKLPPPLIVMGDFNADWSSEDSPVRLLARGLGLRAFRPAAQELGTYKGSERLDWILISAELTFIDYTVLPDIVSDHLAVVARIGWKDKG